MITGLKILQVLIQHRDNLLAELEAQRKAKKALGQALVKEEALIWIANNTTQRAALRGQHIIQKLPQDTPRNFR